MKYFFSSICTILLSVTLVFTLLRLAPGNPYDLLQEHGERTLTTKEHGTYFSDYKNYLSDLAHGSLGVSIFKKTPVTVLIAERAAPTIILALASTGIAIAVGVILGLFFSIYSKKIAALNIMYSVMMSIPSFWLGPLLVMAFALNPPFLPISDFEGTTSIILPALTLSMPFALIIAKNLQIRLSSILKTDYLRTARAKGASLLSIYLIHALPNAIGPIIILVCLQLGSLLSGAVITESIFDWPGIGTLLYEGIQLRDYPVVQGCVLVISLIFVILNQLANAFSTLLEKHL